MVVTLALAFARPIGEVRLRTRPTFGDEQMCALTGDADQLGRG
jgi:hypothetical protein